MADIKQKTELIITALNESYKTKLIPLIENESSNKECFDCGSKNPEFISINNGVFICKICVTNHNKYPLNISCVIKNDLNLLKEDQLYYLYCGGNKKLLNFITYEYPQLQSLHPEILYKTEAMQYYRQRLKYLVDGKDKPKKPNAENCYNIIQNINLSIEKNRKSSGSRLNGKIKTKKVANGEYKKYENINEKSGKKTKKMKDKMNINIQDNLINENQQNSIRKKVQTDDFIIEEEYLNKIKNGSNINNKQTVKKITNYNSNNKQTNYNTISNQYKNHFSLESKEDSTKQKNNNIIGKYSQFNSIKTNSTSTGCDSNNNNNNNANYVYEQRGSQPIKIDKIFNEKDVYYKPRPTSTSVNKKKCMNSSYSSFYSESKRKNSINTDLKSPGIFSKINYFRFHDLNSNIHYLHDPNIESPSTQSVNMNKLITANKYYKNYNIGNTNSFYDSTLRYKKAESNSNSIKPYNVINGQQEYTKEIESYCKYNNHTEYLDEKKINGNNNNFNNFLNSDYCVYKINDSNMQYKNKLNKLNNKLNCITKPVIVNLDLNVKNKNEKNNSGQVEKNIYEIYKNEIKKEEKNERNGKKELNEKIDNKTEEKNKNNEKNNLKDIVTGNFFINFNDIEKKLKIHKTDKMKKIKKKFEKTKKTHKKNKNKNKTQTVREIQSKPLDLIDEQKNQTTILKNRKNQTENIINKAHRKILSSGMDINNNDNYIQFLKRNLGQNTNTEEKSNLTTNIPKERKIIGFRVQKIEKLKTNGKNTVSKYSDKNNEITSNKMDSDTDNFSMKNTRPSKISAFYSNKRLKNSNNKPINSSLSKTGVYLKKKFNIHHFSSNSLSSSVYSRQSSCGSSDNDVKNYFTSLKKMNDMNEKDKLPSNIRITKIDEVKGDGMVETKFLDCLNNLKSGYITNSVEVFNDKN